MMAGRLGQEIFEAIATAVLAATLVLGSAFVWIGVPLGGLWLAGRITADPEHFLLLTLCSIPTAMVVFGWLLYRVNSVYERLRAGGAGGVPQRSAWLRSSSAERRSVRAGAGPRPLIDMAMTGSAWVAFILMAIWFFFFAELRLVSW